MASPTPTNTVAKIQVAIIGGGIGGLTLSAALGLFDKTERLEVNVYEASHQITEIGAGIGVWPRTWKILKELGLEDELSQYLNVLPDNESHAAWEFRKSDEAEGTHINDLIIQGNLLGFHRADLQQTLLHRSRAEKIHINKRLTSVSVNEAHGGDGDGDGKVHLEFADGTSAACDILIGFDGIKSVVRKYLLPNQHGLSGETKVDAESLDPVRWTGTIAYRGLVEEDTLEAAFPGHRAITTPVMYLGKSKHVLVYPVQRQGGKALINIAAFVAEPEMENADFPPIETCSTSEVVAAYAGWEEELTALLQCIEKPTKWPIGHLIPLDKYASGRIFIGGDAAHAMPPHQGSGAGQAIEDAYLLAHLLGHPKFTNTSLIPKLAEIYNTIRLPEGTRVQRASIATGHIYDFLTPDLESYNEGDSIPLDKLEHAVRDIETRFEWTWRGTAENDVRRALGMVEEALALAE